MHTTQTFFRCALCGNLVGMIHDSGVRMECCGQPMDNLMPNTVDASVEKHLPVIQHDGQKVTVRVGAADHPMLEEHHIEWIYLLTKQGGQRKQLQAGDLPAAQFYTTADDMPLACYAYCNLHGLWRTDL